jgi:hypothetical protein
MLGSDHTSVEPGTARGLPSPSPTTFGRAWPRFSLLFAKFVVRKINSYRGVRGARDRVRRPIDEPRAVPAADNGRVVSQPIGGRSQARSRAGRGRLCVLVMTAQLQGRGCSRLIASDRSIARRGPDRQRYQDNLRAGLLNRHGRSIACPEQYRCNEGDAPLRRLSAACGPPDRALWCPAVASMAQCGDVMGLSGMKGHAVGASSDSHATRTARARNDT